MKSFLITPPENANIEGEIILNGSKSIANRALIIRALTEGGFEIDNLSNADDTAVLDRLLNSKDTVLDAGAGGTTFRFLTAYLSTCEGREVVLTGTKRMQERPIKLLVNALRELGAEINYENIEGFPPLRIKGKKLKGGKIAIPAGTSSQYISALLLIAPILEDGMQLELVGDVVSLPYILMTINLMKYFGATVTFSDNIIDVKPSKYQSQPFFVEADWSAASYYYAIAMLANHAKITLKGLSQDSVQGDAQIANILSPWVSSSFDAQTVTLINNQNVSVETFSFDFLECPDLAQTVIVALAAKHINSDFRGLKTLLIKETDRVAALNNELSKYGASLQGNVEENYWKLDVSQFSAHREPIPSIATYEDHRMAMSFAPLALVSNQILIEEPNVVTKSYPKFWEDLKKLGFSIEEV
ncbi:MAG: hypothetical protein LC105_05610 [Chitinophagales bacterium]|nr:hypothetical protein [Chitinophagales bacterium]MCZ2393310.1 hypothetical protein [Chitinophagales bacterium]